MFRGTSWLVPALLSTACTLRAPPGPWPDEWSTWEESKDVTTTAHPVVDGPAEPELPEFDEPWSELPFGPMVPQVAQAGQPPPSAPEAGELAATEAPTEVAPPVVAAPEVAAAGTAPEGDAAPAPEAVAEAAAPGGDPAQPPAVPPGEQAAAVPATDPAASGAAGAAPEPAPEVAAAEAPPPPAPPFSDVELLDAQVFSEADAPLGTLQNLIVDPSSGAVLGAVLQPPEPDAKARFLSMSDLARRPAGGGLLLLSSGVAAPDVAEVFAAEDIVPIKGEVTSLEPEPNGPEGSALLKVRDAENLLHRIRLAAHDLVMPHLPGLEPGVAIEARAAAARDGEGKVWIAQSLASGDRVVNVRDAAGTLLWEELSANMLASRTLVGRQVVHAGATHTVAGWTLAPDAGRIAEVALRSEAGVVTVPWGAVSLTGEQR